MLFAEGNEYVEQDSTKAMFHFVQAVRPYYKHFSDFGLSPELPTWALDVGEKHSPLSSHQKNFSQYCLTQSDLSDRQNYYLQTKIDHGLLI